MAGIGISHDDIIDVEFETVSSGASSAAPIKSVAESIDLRAFDQLALLRTQFPDTHSYFSPDVMSPIFLGITLICAFIVFLVSGGHALLY